MRRIYLLILTVVLTAGLSACALADAGVTVSWYAYTDNFLITVRDALRSAFDTAGIVYTDRDANNNQSQQLEDIFSAVNGESTALIVNLVQSGSTDIAATILESGRAAGIPVVFFNRAVSEDDADAKKLFESYEKSCFVGTSFEEAGEMQGDMIGDYLVANYDAVDLNGDGVISYIMLKGDETNQEAIARTKYAVVNANAKLTAAGRPELVFYDADNSDRYIVDTSGSWSTNFGYETMQGVLEDHTEADGNMIELVISNNDAMAFGVISALREYGYNMEDGSGTVIPIFGVDALEEATELIAQGVMAGTVKQNAEGMAEAIVTITGNLLAGKMGSGMYDGLNENFRIVDGWFVQIPYEPYLSDDSSGLT